MTEPFSYRAPSKELPTDIPKAKSEPFVFKPAGTAPAPVLESFTFAPPTSPAPLVPPIFPEETALPPMARAGYEPFTYAPPDPTGTAYEKTIRQAADFPKTVGNAFAAMAIGPIQEFGHQLAGVGRFLDGTWTGHQIMKVGESIEESARADITAREEAIQSRVFDPTDALLATVGSSLGTSVPALATGALAIPTLVRSIGTSIPTLATNFVASPLAATTILGYATGQAARNEALDQGLTEYQAYKHGAWQGAVEGITELPTFKLFDRVMTGKGKQFVKTLLTESGMEQIATFLQSWENKVTMNPDQSWEEWREQLKDEMVMTAVAVPLTVGAQYGGVSLVQKTAKAIEAYDMLVEQEQERKAIAGVKREQATELREKMKQILIDTATEGDQEEAESVLVHHGSPVGQLDSFDDLEVGKREVGPEVPASDLRNTRAWGHNASESVGFASMFTRGPGSQEDIKEVSDLPTSVVDVAPPQQLMDIREFLAKNAPQANVPLPEPAQVNLPSTPMAQSIRSTLAPIYEKWGAWQSGDLRVHVYDNINQVPQELRSQRPDNWWNKASAIYDGAGGVHVFADAFSDPAEVIPKLYHESFGHYGMDAVVPNWSTMAPQVLRSAPTEMPASWEAVQKRYAEESPRVQAMEVLAHFVENNPNATNGFVENIWSNLRNWTRNQGFNLDVTKNDVVALLRKSREAVEQGKLGNRGEALLASRSEWDPSVRRWGEAVFGTANFAIVENPSTEILTAMDPAKPYIMRTGDEFGTPMYAAVNPGKATQFHPVTGGFDLSKLPAPLLLASRGGKVNTVKINPTTYLDLEKTLLEQPKKVQDALRAAGIVPSSLTGQEFYDALVKREGGKKEASKWLDENNIPGATYRESFRPRGQKEQLVRNYITFAGKNMAVMNAAAQNAIAQEKARQQSVLREAIEERMRTPPEVPFKKKLALVGKAIKLDAQTQRLMKKEAVVWNKFLEYATGIEEINATNNNEQKGITLPALQNYTEAVRKLWGLKGSWSTAANEQIKRWRAHIKAGQQNEHFDTLMLEAGLLSEQLGRKLTVQELQDILRSNGLTTLKDAEIKFAEEVWEDYRKAFRDLGAAVIMDVRRRITNEDDMNTRIAEIQAAIDKAVNQNFFPHSNFGEWSIEFTAIRDLTYKGRDFKQGEVVHYSTHTSQRNQRDVMDELQRTEFPPAAFREKAGKIFATNRMEFMGVPPAFTKTLLDNASESFTDAGDLVTLAADIQKLEQEHSSISRLMKRVLKNTGAFGYDDNSQRVYANFMQRFANQIAKITYDPFMQSAISEMNDVRGDNVKRQGIHKYMKDHRAYLMNPGNELSWLRGFGYSWYLAAVPKSAAVNLLQTPFVSLPWLSKRYGMASATKALALNLDSYWDNLKGLRKTAYHPAKIEMFNELILRGDLAQSFANTLASVAEGSTFEDMTGIHTDAVRKFDRAAKKGMEIASFLFHHAEGVNRYIIAGATYDLALKAGKSQAEATNDAMMAIKQTQGEYARYNRPKGAWHAKSAIFLFMRYVTQMLWLQGYDPAKYRILLMLLMVAGITGLPGAGHLMDLVSLLGTQFKKHFTKGIDPLVQAEEDLLRFLDNIRSDVVPFIGDWIPSADTMMHGFSRNVPIPFSDETTDLSQSLSLGRPIQGLREVMAGDLGGGLIKSLGAIAAIPADAYDAATSAVTDRWKLFESTLPMSFRNVSAGTRWMVRGYETNPAGQIIQEFDPSEDMGLIVAKMGGFPNTRLNQTRELDYIQKQGELFYSGWKKAILSRAYAAYMRGNEADQSAVIKEVYDFNDRVPFPEMGISSDAFNESITGKARLEVLQRLGYPAKTAPYARFYKEIEAVHERATK